MTSLVRHLTFDSHDAYRQGTFWAEVLGGSIADDDVPGDPEALVQADGITLLFVTVPDAKTVKNRVHVDLLAGGGPAVDLEVQRERVAAEVARLEGLGATRVEDHTDLGTHWVVMRDPEGNEFCV